MPKPRISKRDKRALTRERAETARAARQPIDSKYSIRCEYKPKPGDIRREKDPDDLLQQTIEWCDTKKDIDGSWSWGQPRLWTDQDWESIHRFFDGLGTTTWGDLELRHGDGERNGAIPLDQFEREEVRCRWLEIGNEEWDSVYKVRLTGKRRTYGIRHGAHFFLVWWDPKHALYPVQKRGT